MTDNCPVSVGNELSRQPIATTSFASIGDRSLAGGWLLACLLNVPATY